jgi:acetyl-CoA carboxylase biotin carboxyl carrier protein
VALEESTVANEVSPNPGPFDVERIKVLVGLMRKHDLSEIDLHDGAMRIRLRRGLPANAAPVVAVPLPNPAVAATPTAPPAARAAEAPEPAIASKKLIEIKAPTPGTFYARPSPDAEPFVRVGSRVTPTTVVCLIEAMKLFNNIEAECSGVIAEILVENGDAVEYGQVLFRVDPTG